MKRRTLSAVGAIAFAILLATPVLAAGAQAGRSSRAHGNAHGKAVAQSRHSGASQSSTGQSSTTVRGNSPSAPDQDGVGMDRGIVNNDKTGPGNDGNNGCGNDADREDDDNGLCGHTPPSAAPRQSPASTTQVLGLQLHRSTAATSVLGVRLPRTGLALAEAAAPGVGLVVVGLLLVAGTGSKRRRSR